MDFGFIKDVIPLYGEAAVLTLKLSLAGIVLSFAVGLVCALVKFQKIPVFEPDCERLRGIFKEHAAFDSAFLFVFCVSADGNKAFFCAVRGYRAYFSWRKLYGRNFPLGVGKCF